MNNEIESIDTCVERDLAERALAISRDRQKWEAIKDFYRPIIRALQKLEIEPRLSSDIDVNFTGDAHKLAAVVRILRTHGFITTQTPPKAGDSSWWAYYSHPQTEVKVWLNFSSSVCRRVKIGTKMVEQDVYETVCNEITDLSASS